MLGALDRPTSGTIAFEGRDLSRLGDAELAALADVPAELPLVPFAELEDPRPVYELDDEVSRDIPNQEEYMKDPKSTVAANGLM